MTTVKDITTGEYKPEKYWFIKETLVAKNEIYLVVTTGEISFNGIKEIKEKPITRIFFYKDFLEWGEDAKLWLDLLDVEDYNKYTGDIVKTHNDDTQVKTNHAQTILDLKAYLDNKGSIGSETPSSKEMLNFSIRIDNLELRSCDVNLTDNLPHTRAKVVIHFKDMTKENILAYWLVGSDTVELIFENKRPFLYNINCETFMYLAKVGQDLLEKYVILED